MQVQKFRKVSADLLLNEMKLSLVILSVYEQLYRHFGNVSLI